MHVELTCSTVLNPRKSTRRSPDGVVRMMSMNRQLNRMSCMANGRWLCHQAPLWGSAALPAMLMTIKGNHAKDAPLTKDVATCHPAQFQDCTMHTAVRLHKEEAPAQGRTAGAACKASRQKHAWTR